MTEISRPLPQAVLTS